MHVHVRGKALVRLDTYKRHFHNIIGTIDHLHLYYQSCTLLNFQQTFRHITMVSIPGHLPQYCKFGNFRENFILANSSKRYI